MFYCSLTDMTRSYPPFLLQLANNMLLQAQQLKSMIEQAKQQTQLFRDAAVQQVKAQMEKEKQEVGQLLAKCYQSCYNYWPSIAVLVAIFGEVTQHLACYSYWPSIATFDTVTV